MDLKSFKTMRWLTLVLQSLSIVFNYLAGVLGIGEPIATVTDSYDSLFRPAGYTFAIWGIIYLALLIYCIYQLLPSQATILAYERLNKYVRFTAIMSIGWQIAFRTDFIPVSAGIIVLMLIAGIVLFARAHYAVRRRRMSLWFTVPFSLNLAWLSVATVANFSILFRFRNVWWNGAGMEPETWVIILLAILLLITQSVSNHFKDFVFPLVVSWGSLGIWVTLRNNGYATASASLGAAVIALMIAAVTFYKRQKNQNGVQPSYSNSADKR